MSPIAFAVLLTGSSNPIGTRHSLRRKARL
jgi:hypothetical protein